MRESKYASKFNDTYSKMNTLNQNRQPYNSNITAQQRFKLISEQVLLQIPKIRKQVKGCQMHPKLSKRCRQCAKIEQKLIKSEKNDQQLLTQVPKMVRLNNINPIQHLNQKLIQNIVHSLYYQKQIKSVMSIKQLMGKVSFQDIPMQAYIRGNNDQPTQFMIILYRIMELRPTKEQLTIMLRHNNINIRIAVHFEDLYGWLQGSFEDNKLMNGGILVKEYAHKLLDENQLNHGGIRLPRIPTKIQRKINLIRQNYIQTHQQKEEQEQQQQQQQQKDNISSKFNRQKSRQRSRQKHSLIKLEQQKLQQKQIKYTKYTKQQQQQQQNNIYKIKNKIKQLQQQKYKQQFIHNKYNPSYNIINNQNNSNYDNNSSSQEIQKYQFG